MPPTTPASGDKLVKITKDHAVPVVPESSTIFMKVFSALFYGIASFLIMVINKNVLTVHGFPSFNILGLSQMIASLVGLLVARSLKLITFPRLNSNTFESIWPLPILFLGNLLTGLGGTKELSLPMVVVLRRFTSVITMAAEYFILHIKPSCKVQSCIYIMMVGAVVAAVNDLSFNALGYILILSNDFCTAGSNVFTKKLLNKDEIAKNTTLEMGKYGLIFYNNLFMVIPALAFSHFSGDFENVLDFEGFQSWSFCCQFTLSSVFGFVLLFSQMLCVQHNSALMTNIVGCLKNVVVTYFGMIFGGDYIFSMMNFVGLNISMGGSLIYTYIAFKSRQKSVDLKLPQTVAASSRHIVQGNLDSVDVGAHRRVIRGSWTDGSGHGVGQFATNDTLCQLMKIFASWEMLSKSGDKIDTLARCLSEVAA
eukprot:maker-scaffold137_size321222-snap-gene-2.19 protein:Tk01558 transcript:maker-scaffold137_size321222-snap-gene-2.19-mRNA-1 annotation:"udp-sugar transporter ust74c"